MNMNEELQFGYPAKETDIEGTIALQSVEWRKSSFKIICVAFLSMLCFIFMLYFNGILQTVFTALACIGFAAFMLLYKSKKPITNGHFLCINAYESYVDFDFYSTYSQAYHTHAHLDYRDIKNVSFGKSLGSNKLKSDYGRVAIAYYNTSGNTEVKRFDTSGKELPINKESFLYFDLNTNTPEQGFFFYTAHKLFPINYDRKKIVRRFGDEDSFYGND